MKYIIMVSHGMFAPGLHNALTMLLGGERNDILSTSLLNGMGADQFAENFKDLIANITEEDEIFLLGDIVGGSPLTTAMNVLNEKDLLKNTHIIGGMNLPMVLNAALSKDDETTEALMDILINETRSEVKEFVFEEENSEDDI